MLYLENVHFNFSEVIRVNIGGKQFERVDTRIGGLMDRLWEIFENAPDTTSDMEVKDIAVVSFEDSVNMVTLESHGEERCLKDGGKYTRIMYRVKVNNLYRRTRRKNSEVRFAQA